MRETYQEQLDEVTADLVRMTELVADAMSRATRALLDCDRALAEQVIADDEQIDLLTSEVETDCYQVVALQAPVATDLRVVVAALRISASLERMGDLAAHVAKSARLTSPSPALPVSLRPAFRSMADLAQDVVSRVGTVITTQDISLVPDIARLDERMDQLHRELFAEVLSPDWDLGVEAAVNATLLSRFYERYADHSLTIAKRVIYVVTGEPYRSVDPVGVEA
jgi:phosphate transport system protein